MIYQHKGEKTIVKKTLTTLLALILVAAMLFCACGSKTSNLKLATGGTTGTYYAYGGILAQTISDKVSGVKFDVQSTGASKANIYLLADGEVDMALVQNDVMDYAYNGTDLFEGEKISGFSAMAALYAEVIQIVASSDITSIEDLKGKRVSVGDQGSGTEFNTKQILATYGITFDDITVQNLGFGDSATAFKDGKIDAFFCTAGAPTTAITELATTNSFNLLTIDDEHAQKLIAEYPFYTQYTIPADTYKAVAKDATTVAVKATIIVKNDLDETLVYNMTKAIFENAEEIKTAHAKGAELDPAYAVAGVSVPFHAGAEKYFKEAGVLK